MLPSNWLRDENPNVRPIQADISLEEALEYNAQGYNIYYYPNEVNQETYDSLGGRFIQAKDITEFNWVFCDLDLKDYKSENPDRRHEYATKEEFVEKVTESSNLTPTSIVYSGNGVHIYWLVSDLDAKSYLRLSRRLCRKFKTDPAVSQIKQLMRVAGTANVKTKDYPKLCEEVFSSESHYTCEELDKWLPPITAKDEEFCERHYNIANNINQPEILISDKLPKKFEVLFKKNKEVKRIFSGEVEDRSGADWRLTNILHSNGFTEEEAASVLVNTCKARERRGEHRISYATNLLEKVFRKESSVSDPDTFAPLAKDKILAEFTAQHAEMKYAINNPTAFVDDAFKEVFMFTTGITFVGAKTGAGKSTTCYNLIANIILTHPEKRILLLPNEATIHEVLSNVACLLLGYDWKSDFNHSSATMQTQSEVFDMIETIVSRLEVIPDGCTDLTYIEKVLDRAKGLPANEKPALIILDYLQAVSTCEEYPGRESFQISKSLGLSLKNYARECTIPIVVFGQISEETTNRGAFGQRIENDRTFLNHCHNAIEAIPDYAALTTTFHCRKQRFGGAPTWAITLPYNKGRLGDSLAEKIRQSND